LSIVNLIDFAVVAEAWLTVDPNHPTTPPDPGLPNPWNPACDFDADMDIDLGDLAYFVYDGYWLWQACWRESSEGFWTMGGEMMQSSYPMTPVVSEAALRQAVKAEPTIEEEYAQAKEITEWLEDLWATDEDIKKVIGKKDWKEFMKAVYDWLGDIEDTYNSTNNN